MLFGHIKVGDEVLRMLAGTILLKLKVTEVTDKLIVTGSGWTFDPATGAEVDEYLNWGPPPLMTGSFLTLEASRWE
jgi:hypothetical protein